MCSSKVNLAILGLVALKVDRVAHDLGSIGEDLGLFHRLGMLTENGEEIESWRVERCVERAPWLSDDALVVVLERLRRVHGEITKCRELFEASKSFPRNTTKEPL